MKINSLFLKKTVVSFEIFPPKRESDESVLHRALDGIRDLAPDYVSVTYGAGGSGRSFRTAELAGLLKSDYGIEPLAHVTGLYSTKAYVLEYIDRLRALGVQNVLALRGDRDPDHAPAGDFAHASDLVAFIRAHSDLNVIGACYPETHPESTSAEADLDALRRKVDAGVTSLNTQLFFDNEDFFRFRDAARAKGIHCPIQAGIMPIVRTSQIERTVKLSAAKLPAKFSRMVARFGSDPEAMESAGIAYATEQLYDLVSGGVDGIHLYIMNNACVAQRLVANLAPILRKE